MTRRNQQDLSDRIALEAARLMHVHRIDDPALARRKAMQNLGVRDSRLTPDLRSIEQALAGYRQLFGKTLSPERLHLVHQAAADAMRFFDRFQPRLFGPLLLGTASVQTPVQLHLHADHPDDVALFLIEHRIDNESRERWVCLRRGPATRVPAHDFRANEVDFELTVLPMSCLRQPPIDEDGEPVSRAALKRIEQLARQT